MAPNTPPPAPSRKGRGRVRRRMGLWSEGLAVVETTWFERCTGPAQAAGGERADEAGTTGVGAGAGGSALPARRHLGRAGRQLRAVLGQRHQGRAVPVRRRGQDASSSASSCRNTPTRSGTATCPTPGPARSTAIACTAPTSPTPATASTRTSCCSTPMPSASSAQLNWDPALFGYTIGAPDEDLSFDERDSAPFMPKCLVIDPAFTWGRDAAARASPWDRTIVYETACARLHQAPPRGAASACAAPSPGSASRRWSTTSTRPRRHRGRAAADPHLRQRPPPAGAGPDATTGATTRIGFFAPDPRYAADRPTSARVQGDGGALARRRARGDPRRRLQPHRRGQRARPDAVVQGHRQRLLLPAAAGRASATTSTTPAPATR